MIGYIRVSTAREEMISPELQRIAIRDWAARNGRRMVGWLDKDTDASGRDFAKRQIAEGITLIETGHAQEIGVYRYSRWGRNALKSLANIQRVEAVGGRVVSVTEPFDATTAVGRYSRTNVLALDEMQSDLISEGWRDALAHRVGRGLPTSGGPRFGYTYTSRKDGGDGLYHPDPITGPLLAGAYHQVIAGTPFAAAATHLNGLGIRTHRGARWDGRGLHRVMDTGFAAGLLNIGARGPRHNVEYLPAAHTPLIDKETWAAYLRHAEDVRDRWPRERNPTYRLTGLLICGHCGAPAAHVPSYQKVPGARLLCKAHKVDAARCRSLWVLTADVETAVRDWVAEQVAGHDTAYTARLARQARREQETADVDALTRDRAALDRQLLTLTDQVSRLLIPEDTYTRLRDELLERAAGLDRAITVAQRGRRAALEPPTAALVVLLEAWDELPPGPANAGLRAIVGAVLVFGDGTREPLILGAWELR